MKDGKVACRAGNEALGCILKYRGVIMLSTVTSMHRYAAEVLGYIWSMYRAHTCAIEKLS